MCIPFHENAQLDRIWQIPWIKVFSVFLCPEFVISSVQLLSRVWLFATPWTAACQASLSINNSQELAQTYIHWVVDAVQPPHPLSSPSPGAFSLSQHQGLFQASVLRIRWLKYWSFNFSISPSSDYSGLISFRIYWFDLLVVSPRDSQESSPTPQFKSINSLVLSFLYGPILTSIHDYWKNHSFD